MSRSFWVAASTLLAGLLAAYESYGYRVLLRAALGGDFTRVTDFPLRDSLPALEGGLSNLEAFKATAFPSWRANAERSLWVADSLGTIHVEYFGEKQPFDSVILLTWVTGGSLRARTFRTRANAWGDVRGNPIPGWIEVVSAYVSFPPVISFRSPDSAVTLFEPAEGRVFHVVKGWYGGRKERVMLPDTVYPAPATGDDVQLMVRGGALAVVNTAPRPVTLRLAVAGEEESVIVGGDSSSVSVYRTLMKGRAPPVLAYTEPGKAFAVFGDGAPEPSRFFVWLGNGGKR